MICLSPVTHPAQLAADPVRTTFEASETFFYAYLMGWPNIAVYDGGRFEWGQDESNPIEIGEP